MYAYEISVGLFSAPSWWMIGSRSMVYPEKVPERTWTEQVRQDISKFCDKAFVLSIRFEVQLLMDSHFLRKLSDVCNAFDYLNEYVPNLIQVVKKRRRTHGGI